MQYAFLNQKNEKYDCHGGVHNNISFAESNPEKNGRE